MVEDIQKKLDQIKNDIKDVSKPTLLEEEYPINVDIETETNKELFFEQQKALQDANADIEKNKQKIQIQETAAENSKNMTGTNNLLLASARTSLQNSSSSSMEKEPPNFLDLGKKLLPVFIASMLVTIFVILKITPSFFLKTQTTSPIPKHVIMENFQELLIDHQDGDTDSENTNTEDEDNDDTDNDNDNDAEDTDSSSEEEEVQQQKKNITGKTSSHHPPPPPLFKPYQTNEKRLPKRRGAVPEFKKPTSTDNSNFFTKLVGIDNLKKINILKMILASVAVDLNLRHWSELNSKSFPIFLRKISQLAWFQNSFKKNEIFN
eukprot:Pgem_evm1s3474